MKTKQSTSTVTMHSTYHLVIGPSFFNSNRNKLLDPVTNLET